MLGYELDVADATCSRSLEDFRADRGAPDRGDGRPAARARLRARRLARCSARREAGKPIGRPHLADAVLAHPANAQRLREEGIEGKNELFPPYLVPGAKAYVARSRPTVAAGDRVIHAAGGVAVWAHPFWDLDDPRRRIAHARGVRRAGLDGVECFYATHTEEQTRLLHDAADAHGPADAPDPPTSTAPSTTDFPRFAGSRFTV